MADEEALRYLREGPAAWNEQRSLGKFARADLNGEDLSRADLRGAHLSGARLSGADLSGANLSMADLNGADLFMARLIGANLIGAKLIRSNLSMANLVGANLNGANLSMANLVAVNLNGANLVMAKLSGADVSQSFLSGTTFANMDLRAVEGLETVRHEGPSTIGIDTIYKSKGQIPEIFLRGAGVPEPFIVQMKSLVDAMDPIQFYSCFISYSTKDQAFADRLYADLVAKRVRCWFAPHDMAAGRKIHEQIDEAIRLHERLLLILSPASMASEWVQTEIAKARKREMKERRRVLFPIGLVDYDSLRDWECFDADTGKDSAREIREYLIPDFSRWKDHDSYQQAFERLLRDLKAEAQKQ